MNTAVELSLLNQEVAQKVAETFLKRETAIFNLLKHGQEQGEIPEHYDIKGLSQFIHNSLVGLLVLTNKRKIETIIDLNLSILD